MLLSDEKEIHIHWIEVRQNAVTWTPMSTVATLHIKKNKWIYLFIFHSRKTKKEKKNSIHWSCSCTVTPAIKYYLFSIFFSFTLNNSLSLSLCQFVATQSSRDYTLSVTVFHILSDQSPLLTCRQILTVTFSRSSSSAFLLSFSFLGL